MAPFIERVEANRHLFATSCGSSREALVYEGAPLSHPLVRLVRRAGDGGICHGQWNDPLLVGGLTMLRLRGHYFSPRLTPPIGLVGGIKAALSSTQ
jgi:hypothetical protein